MNKLKIGDFFRANVFCPERLIYVNSGLCVVVTKKQEGDSGCFSRALFLEASNVFKAGGEGPYLGVIYHEYEDEINAVLDNEAKLNFMINQVLEEK